LSFQGVDQELASLPGKYARPDGLVPLVRAAEGEVVGTVAYCSLGSGASEIKRLYVTPRWRRQAIGPLLRVRLLDEARAADYRRMLLDTGDWLVPALALYRALGFTEVPAYYHNPPSGTVYMARDL
jgi:putative acetyltransferase